MISEKNRGRPCRYHAEGSLPQECPYPSAYRGCASFSFLRHCIILKKAVAFRHRRIPDAKRPHTEKRRAICIDSRRSRPVPQRLKQLIGIEPGLTVAGEAGDGLAGIRLAQSLRPDLILLDISMPELSGVEAIPRIREVAPGARILIVSMHATAGHVRAALKAGADGYLLKTADEDEFLVAIRALLKGRKYISTELTGSMIISYVDGNAEAASKADSLTPKEKMVLKLIAEGNSNKDIAAKLNLSVKTIDTHRTSFMKKLDLHNVREVTRFAMQNGLVGDGID